MKVNSNSQGTSSDYQAPHLTTRISKQIFAKGHESFCSLKHLVLLLRMDLSLLRPYYVSTKTRIGKRQDGGYVIEETSTQKADILYSYGVGWDISFEIDLKRKIGLPFRLFDPTMFSLASPYPVTKNKLTDFSKTIIKSVLWSIYFVFLRLTGVRYSFLKEGIAAKPAQGMNTFESHVARYGDSTKNIILKIDIEENEYEVFTDKAFLDSLTNVLQILVEFHNVKNRLNEMLNIISNLSSKFSLVHVHGNNYDTTFKHGAFELPNAIELSFVRNDFLSSKEKDTQHYPISALDFPNDPTKKDYSLPLESFTN